MKWLALMLTALLLVAFVAGCASYIPVGAIYTGGTMGVQADGGATPKMGKACMTSILGLIAVGDASVEAAKAQGGVKEVSIIDYEVNNILGIYGTYCTVVKGR